MKIKIPLLVFAAVLALSGIATAKSEHENVILVIVDDLGYADLSCIGTTDDVHTPNIDRLATRGVRFTQAYATAPICNASRVAIITGRYQQRQGVTWYGGKGLHREDFPTIAETLKSNGYATGYIGKFHHGSTDGSDGRGFPLNHGFDELYGFAGGTKHYLHHGRKHQDGKDRLHQGPMWVQSEKRDVEGFTTELFGGEARKFIRNHRDSPFYLHLSFNAVHNFTHQLPASYLNEKGLEGFDDINPGEDWGRWRGKIGYPAHPEGRDYYLGQLHFLDREIGLLLEELEELALAENTSIILVGDNGGSLITYANNTPLRGGKYTLFEGGVRVPMIVSIPGVGDGGKLSDTVVSTLDLFPTICDLAKVQQPEGLDGKSLVPVLEGAKPEHRELFWETGKEAAVRRGDWKLLVTRQEPNKALQVEKTPVGTFLFNLKKDPREKNDLAASNPKIVAELTQAMGDWNRSIAVKAPAPAPSKEKPISISGVYPGLTMWNNEGECGTGAVVPWAGRLWAITYAPHAPSGSSDKLYEILPDFTQKIFAGSVGGTPANRLIHRESDQLLIGPYQIDKERTIRVLPPSKMFGRITGTSRHLTDPKSKVYHATMEQGLYEVDVNSLDVVCHIRDRHGNAPKEGLVTSVPGAHGKGLYTGHGRVIYSNNGEKGPKANTDPTITAGALVQWKGEGDWELVRRAQFTEISGPGGIYGNADPDKDPVWALGWDARSLILALLDGGEWSYYRLPKGSHSYDGAHGWNTEWPRIREIGEEDLLATMHGTFWRFPAGFSRDNSAGIAPRSNYLKVIGDFCRWRDKIVLGCDDSAKAEFLNTRAFKAKQGAPKQSNSNLWFIDPEKLDQLGPAIGRGSVWLRDNVTAGEPSEPYLFSGYDHRQLHLTHGSDQEVSFKLEVDKAGTGEWTTLRNLTVAPKGSVSHLFDKSESGAWIRLVAGSDADSVSANFQYREHDGRNEENAAIFSGIATPGKAASNYGLMRSLAYNKLGLVAATDPEGDDTGYYELQPDMQLLPVDNPTAAGQLVKDVAQPSKAFTVDAASVILVEEGKRYRLPSSKLYQPETILEEEEGSSLTELLAGNLAIGASVRVSSTHGEYAAENAVDGKYTDESRWIGKQGEGGNWIELDLGEPKTFSNIWLISGWEGNANTMASQFDIQVKSGDAWKTIPGGSVSGNNQFEREVNLEKPVTAQQVRITTGSDEFFRIYEIALFEKRPDIARFSPAGFARERVCREVATERDLLNIHGTFYELPARNAQGVAKIRPVATHNLAIHDFCSHNGLLLFTGLNSEIESDRIFRSADGKAAVWAGVVDDLWQLGKPRGIGGPWFDSQVEAGEVSDPYLMTAYDRKSVKLSADSDTTITLEVDIDGTGLWIPYREFELSPDKLATHEFPDGFSAYWVRAKSSGAATATVMFEYR